MAKSTQLRPLKPKKSHTTLTNQRDYCNISLDNINKIHKLCNILRGKSFKFMVSIKGFLHKEITGGKHGKRSTTTASLVFYRGYYESNRSKTLYLKLIWHCLSSSDERPPKKLGAMPGRNVESFWFRYIT